MPTIEQYAASIVVKYQVIADPKSTSHHATDEFIPLIRQWAKQYLLGITLSGAYAKSTAITLSSSVDLLIALTPVPGKEMKDIFWGLFEFMTDQKLKARTRDVSIQVEHAGLKVDLIPIYRERGSPGNVLFNKKSGNSVHTDVARHIHLIANSGRQQEICALKIWRELNHLDFPSLYLELSTLQALEHERFGQLAENFHSTLRYLANRFSDAE